MTATARRDQPEASLLVVLYTTSPQADFWVELEGSTCVLLSFVDGEAERRFLAECSRREVKVEGTIRAAEQINAVSLRAREKYSRFVAQWPERRVRGRESFKERFTYRGDLSLWWLSSASTKDNEVSKTFDYLCHLEVWLAAVDRGTFHRCLFLGDDPMLAGLLREGCRSRGIAFIAPLPFGPGRRAPLVLVALGQRLWLLAWLALQMVIFRAVFRETQRPRPARAIGFLSLYPGTLEIRDGWPVDRMYRNVVGAIAQGDGYQPLFLCWFRDLGLATLRRLCSQLRTPTHEPRIVLLNAYLTPSDLWLVARQLGVFLRWWWLDRWDRDHRRSFVYDGINVYPLVGLEFRRHLLSKEVPYHLVVARVVERAVKAHPLRCLVSFLELYPFSRAVYYGAKRADPSLVTVAYQHANITKMRMWYTYRPEEVQPRGEGRTYVATMPIPDRYLFQGTIGAEIIRASGYPAERCVLTGSPRYDDLADRVRKGVDSGSISPDGFHKSDDKGRKGVLVTPSLSPADARELVEVTLRACTLRDDCSVLVKLHPDCHIEEWIKSLQKKYGSDSILLVQGNIHDLIEKAALVVTNYSTTGDEALALGRPVVCYSGLRPCIATYLDLPAAPVVHTAEEMAWAIERMLYDEEYRRSYWMRRKELIEGSFYRLDGCAKERVVAALVGDGMGAPGVWRRAPVGSQELEVSSRQSAGSDPRSA